MGCFGVSPTTLIRHGAGIGSIRDYSQKIGAVTAVVVYAFKPYLFAVSKNKFPAGYDFDDYCRL